ncbi:MAG: hypothetical protein CUN57_02375, partial [Phototrophicales bacterium]
MPFIGINVFIGIRGVKLAVAVHRGGDGCHASVRWFVDVENAVSAVDIEQVELPAEFQGLGGGFTVAGPEKVFDLFPGRKKFLVDVVDGTLDFGGDVECVAGDRKI